MVGNYWAPSSSKEFNPSSPFARRINITLACYTSSWLQCACWLQRCLLVPKQCNEMISAFGMETQLVVNTALVDVVALMT